MTSPSIISPVIGLARRHDIANVDGAGDPAEGAVVDVLGVEVVALPSCQRTAIASRKPIFSNALFHSRMPSSTYGRYSCGTVSSTHQTICFFGGESLALGSAFSSRQRLIWRTKVVSVFVLAEVLDGAEEVAHAVVGQARLVAAVGQLHQAVVDHERDAAAVGHAVVAGGGPAAHAPPR